MEDLKENTAPTEDVGKYQKSRCGECDYCRTPSHVGEPSAFLQIYRLWKKEAKKVSLKRFARTLLAGGKEGSELVREWFAHKHGSLNPQRSDTNKARVLLERQATKAAKRKTKSGGK